MLPTGTTIINPTTGIQITLLEAGAETGQQGFAVEYLIQPRMGKDAVGHLHAWWTEEFTILEGVARYALGGKEQTAQPGATLVFPAGVAHLHPWSGGDSLLRVRQRTRFAYPSPQAVTDTLDVYATLYGLARDGKVNKAGLPNPLQLALMLRTLQAHGGYLAGLPPAAQRALFGGLAVVARLVGMRPIHAKYTTA